MALFKRLAGGGSVSKKLVSERVREAEKGRSASLDLQNLDLRKFPDEITKLRTVTTLSLQGNKLATFSEKLARMSALEVLRASNNELSCIPDVVFQLSNLKILDLQRNRIRHIPTDVALLSELKELNMAENRLQTLPFQIGTLKNLRSLDVSGNLDLPSFYKQFCSALVSRATELNLNGMGLSEVPSGISILEECLETAIFTSNQISVLSSELFRLTNLRVLELRNNGLTVLPSGIASLERLEVLGLANNRLESIGDGLGKLFNIRQLVLSNNMITDLPREMQRLDRLEELYLAENRLSQLPTCVSSMSGLKVLDLAANQLKSLHKPQLQGLRNLRSLNLAENSLKTVPLELLMTMPHLEELKMQPGNQLEPYVSAIYTAYRYKSVELTLDDAGLDAVPNTVHSLTHLQTLVMSSNRISSVPDEFRRLTNLTSIDASANTLSEFPPCLLSLENLRSLVLSANGITSVPEEIGTLRQLRVFSLDNNQVTALPESLSRLEHLEVLSLSFNKVSHLSLKGLRALRTLRLESNGARVVPECMYSSSELREVVLAGNYISSISDELGGLRQLEVLDVRQNNISAISSVVYELPSISQLLVSENPMELHAIRVLQAFGETAQKLDLSGCGLEELPQDSLRLTQLQELDLSRNSFGVLDDRMAQFHELTSLDVSRNGLKQLSASLSALKKLERINLSHNALADISQTVLALPLLQAVDVSANPLTDLSWIGRLSALEELYLSDVAGCALPDVFGGTPKLRMLRIDGMQLTELPLSLSKLPALELLDASRNALSFGDTLSLPLSLTDLDISANSKCSALGASIFALQNVTRLACLDLPLMSHPNGLLLALPSLKCLEADSQGSGMEIVSAVFQCMRQQAKALNLANRGLRSMPDDVTLLTHLSELDLSQNSISELPLAISSLTALKILNLSNNSLLQIPADICVMSSLSLLNLTNNQFTSLPDELLAMPALKTLSIGGNVHLPDYYPRLFSTSFLQFPYRLDFAGLELTSLPHSSLKVTQIESLSLRSNMLSHVPRELEVFVKLTTLELSDNAIVDLVPSSVLLLTRLQELAVDRNQLSTFPLELSSLPSLQKLSLNENQISMIPDGISAFRSLSELQIESNRLETLPQCIYSMKLNALSTRGNPLKTPQLQMSNFAPKPIPCQQRPFHSSEASTATPLSKSPPQWDVKVGKPSHTRSTDGCRVGIRHRPSTPVSSGSVPTAMDLASSAPDRFEKRLPSMPTPDKTPLSPMRVEQSTVRIVLKPPSGRPKPLSISPSTPLAELKEMVVQRLNLPAGSNVQLTVCGPLEWDLAGDEDVSEVEKDDVIRVAVIE